MSHANGLSNESKTILVVDDEPSIRTFLETFLAQTGYNVLVAESGEEALEKVQSHQGVIDLMLSNVQLPGMTGVELGAKVSAIRPEIRVILMSGFASGILILNEGWQFLHKPFVPSQLRSLLATLLSSPKPIEVPDLSEKHP